MSDNTKKWIGKGINPDLQSSVSNNVLNVIRAIIEDKNCVVYIPKEYNTISKYKSSPDPAVHFLPSDCGKSVTIVGLQSHQERFNFSMIGLVDVMVEESQENGEVLLKSKKVYRNYSIIKDGKRNMDYICARLSLDAFSAIKSIGILCYDNGVKVPDNHGYNADYVYRIILSELPLISLNWAQPDRIGLVRNLVEEDKLVKITKILKQVKKQYMLEGQIPKSDEDSDIYSEKHDSSSIDHSHELETVDCVQYTIKPDSNFIYDIDTAKLEYPTVDEVSKALKEYSRQLRNLRYINRCVVYAVENSFKKGSYDWSPLTDVPRSKNKKRQSVKVTLDGTEYLLERTIYQSVV